MKLDELLRYYDEESLSWKPEAIACLFPTSVEYPNPLVDLLKNDETCLWLFDPDYPKRADQLFFSEGRDIRLEALKALRSPVRAMKPADYMTALHHMFVSERASQWLFHPEHPWRANRLLLLRNSLSSEPISLKDQLTVALLSKAGEPKKDSRSCAFEAFLYNKLAAEWQSRLKHPESSIWNSLLAHTEIQEIIKANTVVATIHPISRPGIPQSTDQPSASFAPSEKAAVVKRQRGGSFWEPPKKAKEEDVRPASLTSQTS